MKRIIFIIIYSLSVTVYSQDLKKINFILVIDDEIVISPIFMKFIISSINGDINDVNTTEGYYPGQLTLNKEEYENMISDKTSKIVFKLEYPEIEEFTYKFYEIEFQKTWLQDIFLILKIYNLDKKKYRKMFHLIKDKPFSYEVITSCSHAIKLL